MTSTDSKYAIHKNRDKWVITIQLRPGHGHRFYVSKHDRYEEAVAEVARLERGGW